jgi:hypothetical protein
MSKSEKKNYKPAKCMDLKEALAQLEHVQANPAEHELHINKDAGCIHHETQYHDPQSGGKPHQQFVKFPIMHSSSIICTTDDKTKRQSFFMKVDLYKDWPKRDANGDMVRDYLERTHARYCESLDSAELLVIKKKIFARTRQYDTKEQKDADEAMRQISTRSRTKSPILEPEFPERHERAGQVDESRSPYFTLKLWEKGGDEKATDEPVAAGTLVVNGGRQKILTKIYDRTVNFHTDVITAEEALANLVYYKGTAKQGAQMFNLNIQPTIMSMTQYWPVEKKGDSQFKCSMLNVTKKLPMTRSFGMSAEDEQALMADMMAYDADRAQQQQQQQQTNNNNATGTKRVADGELKEGESPEKKARVGDAQ